MDVQTLPEFTDEFFSYPTGRYPNVAIAALRFAELQAGGLSSLRGIDYGQMAENMTSPSHPTTMADRVLPIEEFMALEQALYRASTRVHRDHWREWGEIRVRPYYEGTRDVMDDVVKKLKKNSALRNRVLDVDKVIWSELEHSQMVIYLD